MSYFSLSGSTNGFAARSLTVVNASRRKVLARKLETAVTFWARMRGLLGKKELPPDEGLLLAPCNWVHTMGMRFPIDVLFLDARQVVVAVESLPPNRFGRPHTSEAVLELPWGTAAQSGTEKGDQLYFLILTCKQEIENLRRIV